MKKITFIIMVLFLGSSFMVSQDLVEAAKKEKERRAQLKKKSAVVVTNATLYTKGRPATIRTTQSEDQTQAVQRTTPQTVQRAIPSQPTPPQKRTPPQKIENIDQMDLSTAKVEQVDQRDPRGFGSGFATQVLSSNDLVRNPQFALDKPDGKYAEMPILGFIELEINAKNGPGDDIAIYAMSLGGQEEMPGGMEEGGIPELTVSLGYAEGVWYGILGKEDTGDWVTIGRGTGTNSPEKFDLGELRSVKKVRIMFKPTSADLSFKMETWQASELFFRIDAVESLHK